MLDRDAELETATACLDAARAGDGTALTFAGPAGIGKTRVVEAVRSLGQDRGMRVLDARGSELEREFPFGIVRQLLERPVRGLPEAERASVLSGHAKAVAPLLGLPTGEQPLTADRGFATIHGLYWLVANMADRHPLVIIIDDVQWADEDSLRWLAYLAARLAGTPILLTLAVREGEPATDSTLLDALAVVPVMTTRRLRPLGPDAQTQLIEGVLGTPPGRRFVEAFGIATGGNPFLGVELLRTLRDDRAPATDERAPALLEIGAGTIARAVLARIGRLHPDASTVAQALAVLGEGASVLEVAKLVNIEAQRLRSVAATLVAAGVLRNDAVLAFEHPVIRASIYADMERPLRASMHARAASMLIDEGAAPVRTAVQLLSADPGEVPGAVEPLRLAAERALADGAPRRAARFLERALAEPMPREQRARTLFDLGSAMADGGDPAKACRVLSEAVDQTEEPLEFAARTRALARAQLLSGAALEAITALERAIARLPDEARDCGLDLEAELWRAGQFTHDARRRARGRSARFDARNQEADVPLQLAIAATERIMREPPAAKGARLARRALGDGELLRDQGPDSQAFYMAANVLYMAGDYVTSHQVYSDAITAARERASLRGYIQASCYRALAFYALGRLDDAEADARVMLDAPPDAPLPVPLLPIARAVLASVQLERGALQPALATLDTPGLPPAARDARYLHHFLFARGRVVLATGDSAAALRDLTACAEWEVGLDIETPCLTQWRAAAARAHLALGESTEALRIAEEALQRARAFGSARPLGAALVAAGLVTGGRAGVELIDEAVAVLSRSSARLECARALVELGAALRRDRRRREARESLNEGLALARPLGATALVERAYEELAAAGSRPRKVIRSGVEELTASERRVGRMAADGMTNREIAQALFVTVKTVETHLSRAYLKLDISSRSQLREALDPPV